MTPRTEEDAVENETLPENLCRCGNYDLAEMVVFVVEAVTGLPNGPLEAHTRSQCYAQVVGADMAQCVAEWMAGDTDALFPLLHHHPIFRVGHALCECGAAVEMGPDKEARRVMCETCTDEKNSEAAELREDR
jgi:hypothetical protein